MKSRLANYIYLYPENDKEFKTIKYILEESLIYPNPKFESVAALGLSTRGIPKFIKNYDIINDKFFKIPKGCFDLYEHIKKKIPLSEEDIERIEGSEINFKCKFELRDIEQTKAANSFVKNPTGYGLLSLPCGLA